MLLRKGYVEAYTRCLEGLDLGSNAAQAMLLRKKYVEAYTRCLEGGQVGGDEEVAAMDDQLNEATILVFRRLAHAKAGHAGI